MKTFTYLNYKNCYFKVKSYPYDKRAIAIFIENQTEGPIAECTKYLPDGIVRRKLCYNKKLF